MHACIRPWAQSPAQQYSRCSSDAGGGDSEADDDDDDDDKDNDDRTRETDNCQSSFCTMIRA